MPSETPCNADTSVCYSACCAVCYNSRHISRSTANTSSESSPSSNECRRSKKNTVTISRKRYVTLYIIHALSGGGTAYFLDERNNGIKSHSISETPGHSVSQNDPSTFFSSNLTACTSLSKPKSKQCKEPRFSDPWKTGEAKLEFPS